MSEVKRIAIVDKDGNDVLLTVRPTIDDPTKNGIVICNPDGSAIGGLKNPVQYIDFDTTVIVAGQEARLKWNNDEGCLEVGMPGGSVNLQIGLETFVPRRVKKGSAGAMTNGQLVYITGSQGRTPTVELAQANSPTTADSTLAMLTENIADGQKGFATTFGVVRDVNTNGIAEGTKLYLSPTTAGGFTATKPTQPNHIIHIGYVLYEHATEGEILVMIDTGTHLSELHDVLLSSLNNGDFLEYDSVAGLWKNTSFETKTTFYMGKNFDFTGYDKTTGRSQSVISFVDGTRTVSIAPLTTSYDYWISGVKINKTGTDSVVIGNTEGLHYIYFDTDGVLKSTTVFDINLIYNLGLTSIVYRDLTNQKFIRKGDERHGTIMDYQTHAHLHLGVGMLFYNGLSLTNMTVGGNGSSNSHATIGVANGQVADEDLIFDILSGSPQTLSTIAQIPVFYKDGTSWRKKTSDNYPVIKGTTLLNYNQITAGSGSQVEVATTDFVLTHIYATNDLAEPIIAIQGQHTYGTVALARVGASEELKELNTMGLPGPEMKAIATVIYECRSTFTNAMKARIVATDDGSDYVDWRFSDPRASGGIASTGDMMRSVYDTTNQATDIFAYADTKAQEADDNAFFYALAFG